MILGDTMSQVSKPWGYYEDMVRESTYVIKKIVVNAGEELSKQTHKHRNEFWLIAKGKCRVQLGNVTTKMKAGQTVNIHAKEVHKIINDSSDEVVIYEVQYGTECREDDIVRLDDKYDRKTS